MGTSRRISNRRLALSIVAVAAAVTLAACGGSAGATREIPDLGDLGSEQGAKGDDPAPEFTIATLDGAGFELSEHLAADGRPVFLNLWASWCPPCKEEMPGIDAAAGNHADVKFIGVAIEDDPADSAEFATSIGIAYTIGFDEEDVVSNGYNPLGLPASYIISSEGEILERIYGTVTEQDISDKIEGWFGA